MWIVVTSFLLVVTMALFIGIVIVTIAALYWMKKKMTPKTVTEEEGNFNCSSFDIMKKSVKFISFKIKPSVQQEPLRNVDNILYALPSTSAKMLPVKNSNQEG